MYQNHSADQRLRTTDLWYFKKIKIIEKLSQVTPFDGIQQ